MLGHRAPRTSSLVALITNAPLPCQMELCYCGTLEPNANAFGVRSSACDKTEDRQSCVHACNGAKSTHGLTERERVKRERERERVKELKS